MKDSDEHEEKKLKIGNEMIGHSVEDKVCNCNTDTTNSKDKDKHSETDNESKYKDDENDSEDNESENESDEYWEEEEKTHWGDINWISLFIFDDAIYEIMKGHITHHENGVVE